MKWWKLALCLLIVLVTIGCYASISSQESHLGKSAPEPLLYLEHEVGCVKTDDSEGVPICLTHDGKVVGIFTDEDAVIKSVGVIWLRETAFNHAYIEVSDHYTAPISVDHTTGVEVYAPENKEYFIYVDKRNGSMVWTTLDTWGYRTTDK